MHGDNAPPPKPPPNTQLLIVTNLWGSLEEGEGLWGLGFKGPSC